MYPEDNDRSGCGEDAWRAREGVERALVSAPKAHGSRQWAIGGSQWRELDLSILADFKTKGFAEYHRDLVRGAAFLTKHWA